MRPPSERGSVRTGGRRAQDQAPTGEVAPDAMPPKCAPPQLFDFPLWISGLTPENADPVSFPPSTPTEVY